MKKFSTSVIFIFGLDIILILLGIYNFDLMMKKPNLSYCIEGTDNSNGCLKRSDIIININDFDVNNEISIETIIDFYNIGDKVSVKILRDNIQQTVDVILTNYYTLLFAVLTQITMLFFLLPGMFILYSIENRQLANVFHLLMISVSIMLILTYGGVTNGSRELILGMRTINQVSYLLFPVSFIHFCLLFPINNISRIISIFKIIYIIIAVSFPFFLIINYYYLYYPGQGIFTILENLHYYFLRPFFIPAFLIVLFYVFNSYIKTKNRDDKEKLLWIIVSICWGPVIYTFFYLIPDITILTPLISEGTMQLLIIVSPISLFIGIYKYRLFDIRLILKRSMIYGFIFVIVISIYLLLLLIFSEFLISKVNQFKYAALLTSGLTVFLYQPVRNLAQNIIDKALFKINFDYHKAQELLLTKLDSCLTEIEIASEISSFLSHFLMVEHYNLLLYDRKNNTLNSILSRNLILNQNQLFHLNNLINQTKSHSLIAESNIISKNIISHNNTEILTILNASVILKMYDNNEIPESLMVLSDKKNNTQYTYEEIELIKFLMKGITNRLKSIENQKIMLFQSAEIKKLEELNNLKNYFVSNVSHELKTPLTAISLYSEILMSNYLISNEERANYFRIIIGECARLSRLINNILDFSKIEKGVKTYNFKHENLNEIVDSLIHAIDYFIELKKFKLNYSKNEEIYLIHCDSDALKEVIYNIIDNSIKYSKENKEINIITYSSGNYYYLEISDKGIGINKEFHKSVFDAYFRIDNNENNNISGTGIGLNLVANIVEAHNGKIELESELGKGTKIIIKFPGVRYEKIISN